MTALVAAAAGAVAVASLAHRLLPALGRRRAATGLRPIAARAAAVVALVATAVVAPPLLLLGPVGWGLRRHGRVRRRQREEAHRVRAALPDLIDLLLLASTAGLSLPIAHPLVAQHAAPPVGPRLLAADAAATSGQPRADALIEALAPLGDRARALADVLVDHLRYGVPLVPGLERAGLELRLERRRAAELDARRVPVRLLGPLVACVLPAFALLTVVPLLAASLDALPT